MTFFNLTSDERGRTLSIFFDNGDTETIPETHISFQAIIDKFLAGTAEDSQIRELTRVLETVATKMEALSERVSVDGKEIYFDGDPLAGELGEVIKSLFAEGSTDFGPLVNFLEKAKTNPSLESVDDLYRWIKNGDLVIAPDGDIIAYKGVAVGEDGLSYSISHGTAFVNGEKIEGAIPNAQGSIITMPRSEVDPKSQHYCSTGLHAGTYSYASGFAQGRLILVKFNPRDVVSCPKDSGNQKLRICRYEVLGETKVRLTSALYKEKAKEAAKVAAETPATPAKLSSKNSPKQTTVTAQSSQSYRDPKTGRFVKGGNAPRDPKTGQFLKGI